MKTIRWENLKVYIKLNEYEDDERIYTDDDMSDTICKRLEEEIENSFNVPQLQFILKHKDLVVGEMSVHILPLTSNPKNLYYICNGISQQLSDYAEFAKDNPMLLEQTFRFHISKLNINNEYRNNGLGSYFLQELCEYISSCFVESKIFSLKAYPIEVDIDSDSDKFNNIEKQLINFYLRNGFKQVKDTEYMYRIFE